MGVALIVTRAARGICAWRHVGRMADFAPLFAQTRRIAVHEASMIPIGTLLKFGYTPYYINRMIANFEGCASQRTARAAAPKASP